MKRSEGIRIVDPGDATIVLRCYLHWLRRQRHFAAVNPNQHHDADSWPLVKLAAGVWDVPVSIVVPGYFHGFVTLLDVPDPAPWEEDR